MILTPPQRELARHALGLPNQRRRSYRNRFIAEPSHADYAEWSAMVAAGLARRWPPSAGSWGETSYLFKLTEAAARAALYSREELDMEDFPSALRSDAA